MIQLYTWGTPNGKKVSIMLEEVGVPYEVHPINLQKGDQFNPAYLAVNPNNKIPSIIDTDGPGGQPLTLFESGAILMYLAEKTGKLLPQDMRKRYEVIQWLMFQMAALQSLGSATRQEGIPRWRIYDCRYCHVPLDMAARDASGEVGGISKRETLVRRDICSTGGSARDGGAKGPIGCR